MQIPSMPSNLRSSREELRQEYLEEYFDQIYSIFTGRCTPIKSFITDDKGKVSDDKLEALVYDIISTQEDEMEFYHNFFYFALQGIIEVNYEDFITVKNFDDVLTLITITPAHNNVVDEAGLCWSDFKDFNPSWGMIEATRFGCEMLMNKHIASTYSPERVEFCKEHFKGGLIPNKLDDLQEEFDFMVKRDGIHKDVPEWKKSIADPKKFVDCYIKFRDRYIELMSENTLPNKTFYFIVSGMIDDFLNRKKISIFSSLEKTAIAFDRIERFIKTIKTENGL